MKNRGLLIFSNYLNKEATESVQEAVKSIFYEAVEINNLDSKSFNLKVADKNDGPDW